MTNKTLIYKSIPHGLPVAGKDLVIEDRSFDAEAAPPQGGLTIEVLWVSFDPYLRGRMRDPAIKSYVPAFVTGDPVVSGVVARVLKSDADAYKAGDIVVGYTAVAEYAVVAAQALPSFHKVNNPHNLELGHFLGALGMPGLTAWSSLFEIGKPKKGETIFVSSAAGAVGQVVGQIAKKEGLTVIGSAGSDDKVDFITKELGFDAGFNYKTEKPEDALKRLAPKGLDIYYDNVGGETLDAAINHMNDHGRLVECGMISAYNDKPGERYGIKNIVQVVSKRLLIQGFIVGDIAPKYARDHQQKVQEWIADGSFKPKLAVTEGIDNAAQAFIGMLKGENFGKAALKVKSA